MPYIRGTSGNVIEVPELSLAGLLRDPDITECGVDGKALPVKKTAK